MQAQTYVEAFAARGVLLWREGDLLCYDAPPGVLTPIVLEKLRQAKPKILPLVPEAPLAPVAVEDSSLLALAAEVDLEHELLLAHYEKRLPVAVKPVICCPSGRHICNLAVAVSGMLQRHRGEQEGVHIGPKLAQADAMDWEFLLEWWSDNASRWSHNAPTVITPLPGITSSSSVVHTINYPRGEMLQPVD